MLLLLALVVVVATVASIPIVVFQLWRIYLQGCETKSRAGNEAKVVVETLSAENISYSGPVVFTEVSCPDLSTKQQEGTCYTAVYFAVLY